ncbi:uncharacterized protein LOC122245279 [Penaeus japonicus]|uniref:uncharacterized protein LOC122245279 n=1 Tax=Penaeus japonicus TaxID=27405 RepID=UPI001C716AA5|nr:uncharacterized protein LOC122245279 [Penaeus japonicus]
MCHGNLSTGPRASSAPWPAAQSRRTSATVPCSAPHSLRSLRAETMLARLLICLVLLSVVLVVSSSGQTLTTIEVLRFRHDCYRKLKDGSHELNWLCLLTRGKFN